MNLFERFNFPEVKLCVAVIILAIVVILLMINNPDYTVDRGSRDPLLT